MIITAVPHNRRLPEIEFSSAREFERALGNNDPQDYRDFTCDRATPEEAMFCHAVPFDWQRPDEWFEAAQHYTDPDREIDGVPAPVYLIACDNASRRFDDLADFEKFVDYATAFTLEEALDSVASQRANDDHTEDYYNIPEMIEYLKENDWCEVELPQTHRIKSHRVSHVVCHKDALPALRRAVKAGDAAVEELLLEKGQALYGGGIDYDDEETYYFGDLEDFTKVCIAKEEGGGHTAFNGATEEWFEEGRYFDAMMDDYDRIEYEDETYYFYHG